MESLRRRWSRRTRNESCFGNLRLVRQDGASRDQLTLSNLQFLTGFKNEELRTHGKCYWNYFKFFCSLNMRNPRGGYFRNFWVGMCHWDPGTLSLYQSSFKWILLPYTRLNSQNPSLPYPRVFQKLLTSQTHSSQNKTDLIFSYFWKAIPGFPSLD